MANENIRALEEAVEKQVEMLEPAQREFVLAEFATYKWNAARIAELEEQLENGVIDADGYHNYDAEGKLFRQRHQMVAEQSTLFSPIMRWIKNTAAEASEIESFMA